MSESVITLLNALIGEINDARLRDFAGLLPSTAATLRDVAPRSLPVVSCLMQAISLAPKDSLPLINYLNANRDALHWGQTYSATDFGAEFLNGYGWTEFVGTRGPVPSGVVACGVLMLGPQITYPSHSHQAEEVYVPLSGAAEWQIGQGDWLVRHPLEVIHHRSWVPHAMRTGDAPLVALYFWRGGDLAQKSKIG